MKRIYLRLILVVGILSLACTTKVSEWILLNAAADNYMLVYFHKNELSESEKKQQAELQVHFKSANIILKTQQQNDIERPHYALYFKNRQVAKYADANELSNLASSSLRQKVANQLMEGKLCVMLYLKCGIQEKDNAGLQELEKSIAKSPFREIITIIELERNSVDEASFVNMLLNVENDLKTINEPMLFGIFGRFRALEPLLAKGISQENINLMIDFFTADCSCLIKDDLPGRSMPYSGKWENPKTALVNKIIDANPSLEHH